MGIITAQMSKKSDNDSEVSKDLWIAPRYSLKGPAGAHGKPVLAARRTAAVFWSLLILLSGLKRLRLRKNVQRRPALTRLPKLNHTPEWITRKIIPEDSFLLISIEYLLRVVR